MDTQQTRQLLPLGVTARILHLPAAWLRREAEAGRLPCLCADDRFLFDLDLIRNLLVKRAQAAKEIKSGDVEG
jgi:hypothetical protein